MYSTVAENGHKEQNMLGNDVRWLIKHEFPEVFNLISKIIFKSLMPSFNKTLIPLTIVCTSSSIGSDSIQGTLKLLHDTICSLELVLKPSKSQSTFKASFRTDKQWKLQQIQDAYNHIKQAGELLRSMQDENFTPEGLVIALGCIIQHLSRCKQRLHSPTKLPLRALIGSAFSKMFTPSLPGDTLVNFYVLEDKLVMASYTVQQATSSLPLKNSRVSASSPALFHNTNSTLDHAGVRYEVQSANKGECVVPILSNLLATVSSAHSLCENLRKKLLTLQDEWQYFTLSE